MSLWIVWSPSERRVIVDARSVDEAISVGNSFVGGPAQARGATQADIESFPLLGTALRGDTRPAIQADPQFVASFGFTIPGSPARDPRLPPDPDKNKKKPVLPRGGTQPPRLAELFRSPFESERRQAEAALVQRGLAGRLGVEPSGVGSSIFGRALQNRTPDFGNTFGFQRLLAGFKPPAEGEKGKQARAEEAQAFEDFVSNTGGGGLADEALRAFRILSGREEGASPADTANARGQFASPDAGQAEEFARLTRNALSAGVSPLALNLLRLPSGQDLRTDFLAQTGGGPDANFIEFVKKFFPLASTIR